MELIFSDKMSEFQEGIFQMLNDKKNEMQAKGKTVYNLSVGTPDFPPAKHIMEAVAKASEVPENYKYALLDLPELIEAVKYRFEKRYQVILETQEITSVYGSQEGIAHIGFTLCNDEDVVLVPNPGYPIFELGPALAKAKIVTYELLEKNQYLPDFDSFDPQFLKQVKFMIVSYPLNPICKAAPDEFYPKLISWAIQHQIMIIHDNAYSDIIFDGRIGKSILSFPNAKECCVEFYSLSKSYNYTGARMGFLVGNASIVQNLKKLRSQIDYGTFLPVQYGAIAALRGSDSQILSQCKEYQKRRDALCGGLRNLGWDIPDSEGTMFAWGKIPDNYDNDVTFVLELIERAGVLCTPGSSFGSLGKNHVRFALTLPVEQIEEALISIQKSGILK